MPHDLTLKAWETFYVIIGSSAGALTGLQFVVLTLIAESDATSGRQATIAAFGSPNVVHFCAALLVCSILSAPWSGLRYAGIAVALSGACGFVYSVVVLQRARNQAEYRPVLEDWLWHVILPMLAYLALLACGAFMGHAPTGMLFGIGAALLLLVFIGIHNAWDTVTYLATQRGVRGRAKNAGPAESKAEDDAES